ncbi:MAG: glycosyltransferase [Armatimonadetes bacterium]|nr:glycosyltransferase [Armatimonadota bacterium]
MKVLAFPKDVKESNPYTALLYAGVEKLGVEVAEFELDGCAEAAADVFHVHWPESFLNRRNPVVVLRSYDRWMKCLRALAAGGAKIVWTAHNLHTHERRHELLQRKFWKEFTAMLSGCICLSHEARRLVEARFSDMVCPIETVPHGHYREAYPNTASRADAREALGLGQDEFVIVHVGFIRGYKSVPELARAFKETPGDLRLVVAGEPYPDALRKEVESAVSGDPRILSKFQRVPDEELQNYFRATDLAVFPYKNILNSGSALMALSFDVPVLVPGIGSMPELKQTIGEDWVMTYQGEISSAHLQAAVRWAKSTPRPQTAPLDALDWDVLAKKTVDFYDSLLQA